MCVGVRVGVYVCGIFLGKDIFPKKKKKKKRKKSKSRTAFLCDNQKKIL